MVIVRGNEYEYVAYPKLNHVKIGFVEISFRNPHVHREMEIGLVLDGAARMTVNSHSYAMRRGALYFINANEPHDIVSEGEKDVRIAYIQISNHFVQDYLHLFRNMEILWHDLTSHISPSDNLALTQLLLNVFNSYLSEDDLNLLKSFTAICQLFSRLLDIVPHRQFDEASYQARKRRTQRLQRITDYISAHYTEKLSLAALSEMEGITVTHLSHFIHDNLNMTFQEYANNLRLEKAVQLITNTQLRLTDIALECGFSDVKYLTRSFVKRFGCHPRDYRATALAEMVHKSQNEATQTFASEDVGRRWLADFQRWHL